MKSLHGAQIALVLMRNQDEGEDDWAILRGQGVVKGGALYVKRREDDPLFPVPVEAIGRVKKVTPELRDVLHDADWCIPLSVGGDDEDIDPSTLRVAGFVWPE